jgi:hypothetical protein
LQNGNTIEFSVADLVSGLQTELSASNKLNPAYINYDSTHRAVSDTEKSTWNGKQNAIDSSHKLSADLVDDTSTTNKFATAAELEQISTNKTNISLVANQSYVYNKLNIRAETQTVNKITFTVNPDKTITVSSGTASANTAFMLQDYMPTADYSGLIAIGAPSGTSSDFCLMVSYSNNKTQEADVVKLYNGNATTITTNYTYVRFYIYVKAATVITDDVTLTPMLTSADIYNAGITTYQPYAMSNAELTAAIQAIQAQLANQ